MKAPQGHKTPNNYLYIWVAIYVIVSCVALVVLFSKMLSHSLGRQERDLYMQLVKADMLYLKKKIGKEKTWEIKDDGLYVGDKYLGDGSRENANTQLLRNFYRNTDGSRCLIWMRCSDEDLTWCEDPEEIEGGYYEAHYICVCESDNTSDKGLNRPERSDVGWKMRRDLADAIEKHNMFYHYYEYLVGEQKEKELFYCWPIREINSDKIIAVVTISRRITEQVEKNKQISIRFAINFVAFGLITLTGLILITRRNEKDLERIVDYLSLIASNGLPTKKLQLKSKGALENVEIAINDMIATLRENERISDELKLAAVIQNSMLPKSFISPEDVKEYEIYAHMTPAKEIGGDFYDFFSPDDTHLAIIIADVSGKGVPAALFSAITKALLKNFLCMGMEAAEAFTKTNKFLCENNEEEMFVTCWMGIVDLESGKLTYVNAGHNPPFVYHDKNCYYLEEKPDLVLAAIDTIKYTQHEIQLSPGDKLFLYTDGVTEAINENQEFFGEDRLKEILSNNIKLTAKQAIELVYSSIREFANIAEQYDDITMVAGVFNKRMSDLFAKKQDFEPSTKGLEIATEWVEEYLETIDCPMTIVAQINVALEEIFVNIVDYAYKYDQGKINLAIGFIEKENSIILRFTDTGYAFNPLEIKAPDLNLDAESRAIGGLGIHMVRKTMNDVDYKRYNQTNVLTLKKRLPNT